MTKVTAKAIEPERAWTENELKRYYGQTFARKMRNEDASVDVLVHLGTFLFDDRALGACYKADVWLTDFHEAGNKVYDPPRRGLMIIPVGDIVIHDPTTKERITAESLVGINATMRFYRSLAVSIFNERKVGGIY